MLKLNLRPRLLKKQLKQVLKLKKQKLKGKVTLVVQLLAANRPTLQVVNLGNHQVVNLGNLLQQMLR
jgi:hypothetical protein